VCLSIDRCILTADVPFCQQPSVDHSRSSAKTCGCASRSFSAPFPEGRALCLYFHHRAIVGRLSNPSLEGRTPIPQMRKRSGRQDVPEIPSCSARGRYRVRTANLAPRASGANATNESGGEAEIAGGVGLRRGAATRSLRSAREAAHSGAARLSA
jgi:hypothetical protein